MGFCYIGCMIATQASANSQELKKLVLKTFEDTRKENSMRITYSVDNGFKNAKLFVGLGFGFTLVTVTIWATWNVKNILKIDIFPGGHHGMIDDINAGVGM
jgi:hypothetical protein